MSREPLFFIPYSLFFILYSLFFIPYSLFFILYSLFFILYSLFFIRYSLFFILYSLFFSTTEVKGSNPGIEHLIARGKSSSTLCRKSWVYSGYFSFTPQEKLTGWVSINS